MGVVSVATSAEATTLIPNIMLADRSTANTFLNIYFLLVVLLISYTGFCFILKLPPEKPGGRKFIFQTFFEVISQLLTSLSDSQSEQCGCRCSYMDIIRLSSR
jgi:hypothetical protein